MKVLIGCEESQASTLQFRIRGHEAYSCDIQPTRGRPEWHLQGDVYAAVEAADWDLIILHPPCTAMAVSGNGTYGQGMVKHHQRVEAIQWTVGLWNKAKQHAKRVALENPVGVIWNYIPLGQYIQPYYFGDHDHKKTGLALYNLPPLKVDPAHVVIPVPDRIQNMAMSAHRARDRSKTYPGIARAFADQWGDLDGASLYMGADTPVPA